MENNLIKYNRLKINQKVLKKIHIQTNKKLLNTKLQVNLIKLENNLVIVKTKEKFILWMLKIILRNK